MFLLTNLFFIIRSQASFLSKSFRKNNFESFHICQRAYIILSCAVTYMTFCPTNMLEPKEKMDCSQLNANFQSFKLDMFEQPWIFNRTVGLNMNVNWHRVTGKGVLAPSCSLLATAITQHGRAEQPAWSCFFPLLRLAGCGREWLHSLLILT